MELLEQTVTLKPALAQGRTRRLEALGRCPGRLREGAGSAGAGGGGRPQGQRALSARSAASSTVGHPAGGLPVPHLRPSGL